MIKQAIKPLYGATSPQVGKTRTGHHSPFRQWQVREGNVLYRSGVQQLSHTHLLAHVLRDAALAERLMKGFGSLSRIAEASIAELKRIPGVGMATAEILHAVFELSRRGGDSASQAHPYIRNPVDVYMLVQGEYRGQRQEITKAILLNTKNSVLSVETIFVGTLNFSLLHPREIYRAALRQCAASIILVHNHPSGCTDPSAEDIEGTKQVAKVGKLMDIPLLDHLIIGDGDYISFKEKKLI